MPQILEKLGRLFKEKISENWSDCVKFVVTDIPDGHFIMDHNGVRNIDIPASCILSADIETFEGLINNNIDVMRAYMGGQLKIDGSMTIALRLAQFLKD